MSLGYALRRIVEEYPLARLDPPAGHPLAAVIRRGAPDELRAALEPIDGPFLVKGSPGRGATGPRSPGSPCSIPPSPPAPRGATTSSTCFRRTARRCLSLAQGTVAAIRSHGPAAGAHLRASGAALRTRLSDFADALPNAAIALGSAGELPEGYEAAHILGLTYALADLGDERRLRRDLAAAVAAYRALKARAGSICPVRRRPGEAAGRSDPSPRAGLPGRPARAAFVPPPLPR